MLMAAEAKSDFSVSQEALSETENIKGGFIISFEGIKEAVNALPSRQDKQGKAVLKIKTRV